jgi:hypothetical protein
MNLIDPDYFSVLLNNCPPDKTVEGVISFVRFLEESFFSNFGKVLTDAKNIISKIEPSQVIESVKTFHFECNLNKDTKREAAKNLRFTVNNSQNFYLNYYDESINANKNDFLIFCELIFDDETIANKTYNEVMNKLVSRLDEFPYYTWFKEYGGSIKIYQKENKLCVCLKKESELFGKIVELLEDLDFKKFGAEIFLDIYFYRSFLFKEIPSYSHEELLEKLISPTFVIDLKLKNFTNILEVIIAQFEKYKTTNDNVYKDILPTLSALLISNEVSLELNLNPKKDLVKDLLLLYFGSPEGLEYAMSYGQKIISVLLEMKSIIQQVFKKIDFDLNYDEYKGVKLYLSSKVILTNLILDLNLLESK